MSNNDNEDTKKENQSQQILALLEDVRLFCSQDGRAHLETIINGHREVCPVMSEITRSTVRERFYQKHKNLPDPKNIEKAIGLLSHRAASFPREDVFLRYARIGDKIYIDISDQDRNYIEIDPEGYRLVKAVPVNFVRTQNMKPLPLPVPGGIILELRDFVNIGSDQDFILLVSFLVGSLFQGKQYPIAILQGPQGSGKSFISDIAKDLIDPGAPSLRSLPYKEEDLFIAAKNAHLICYDNLSGISSRISDCLCKIATGCGISGRKLYTNDEEYFIEVSKPLIINGIDYLTARPDLADRALVFTLPKISETARIPTSRLWSNFKSKQPYFFGCLLDALSFALRFRDSIKIEAKPRMVDFCLTACAGLQAFGYTQDQVLEAFMANRREVALDTVESNPIGRIVKKFMISRGYWRGTVTDLIDDLNEIIDPESLAPWLRSPQAISRELNRIGPALLQDGIIIDHERKRDKRFIVITKVEKLSSPSSPVTRDDSDDKTSNLELGVDL